VTDRERVVHPDLLRTPAAVGCAPIGLLDKRTPNRARASRGGAR
jgi:hypothetical protein